MIIDVMATKRLSLGYPRDWLGYLRVTLFMELRGQPARSSKKNVPRTVVEWLVPAEKHKSVQFFEKKINASHSKEEEKRGLLEGGSV